VLARTENNYITLPFLMGMKNGKKFFGKWFSSFLKLNIFTLKVRSSGH
jgi:hypothetical protein